VAAAGSAFARALAASVVQNREIYAHREEHDGADEHEAKPRVEPLPPEQSEHDR
jgi:hypothetical protein